MPIEPNPYDRPDLLDIRKDQEDPIVIYIIVRKSLNMDIGKIAAQVGHGVMMFGGRYRQLQIKLASFQKLTESEFKKLTITDKWLETSYRKISLVANDKDWEKLKEQLDVFLVIDAGLTEIASGSETVIVTWPMKKSDAPKFVQRLQALKTREKNDVTGQSETSDGKVSEEAPG